MIICTLGIFLSKSYQDSHSEGVWKMVVAGDMMLNNVSPAVPVFGSWKPVKESVFYANLEIPLTDTEKRTARKSAEEIARRDQFVLKAHPGHIRNLVNGNLDVVSLGNNHAMDGGSEGLNQTIGLLNEAKIPYCGAGANWKEAVEPAVVTSPTGIKIAFVSHLSFLNPSSLHKCTPATSKEPGIMVLTLRNKSGQEEFERMKQVVDRAKSKADLVVICPHWGIEKQPKPAPYQVSMAHLYIDAGADAVVGNHPHVLQPAEIYKGKPIFYSLGNLVNPGGGITAAYEVKYREKEFQSMTFIPLRYSSGRIFPRR